MSRKINCIYCNNEFIRSYNVKKHKNEFCSRKCMLLYGNFIYPCGNCNKEVTRKRAQYISSKSGKIFCNSSCAATYNNTHKTKGTRVSKLERYLQERLISIYPNINFMFNDKNAINSELDIYLPNLKLAFELNGIFHYEPIYGNEKLKQIKNNDVRKFQACLEENIELVTIDISNLKYFKEDKATLYLNIITKIIENKLNRVSDSN
jgi:hypothetical protein